VLPKHFNGLDCQYLHGEALDFNSLKFWEYTQAFIFFPLDPLENQLMPNICCSLQSLKAWPNFVTQMSCTNYLNGELGDKHTPKTRFTNK